MSDRPIHNQEPVPEWIDTVADQFEAAWQMVTPPSIAAFLGEEIGERRAALLMELIQVDLACRAKIGSPCSLADYGDEFPEIRQRLATDIAQPTPLPQKLVSEKAIPDRPNIAGYEILGELGEGGMGVVYKARRVRLGRVEALKMMLAGPKARRRDLSRFQSEMEAVARLRHPNIVQLYDVGEHDGQPYCALEYVDGGNLAQKLAGTPQPPHQAAQVVETLARAIHAAHQQSVIHRDLKPANVLLSSDGTPKISDFGLAKQLKEGEALLDPVTHTGEIVGTPSYMAPEQAQGKPHEVGAAADIYGLGAVLYELLTGRPPFKGETMLDTLEQVRSQDPVAPSRLQPKLPRDLETICLKALAKIPTRRYARAGELADDLRRFLDGKPIQARPVSHGEHVWRWCRRNPTSAGLSAAVFVVLVTSVLVLWQKQAETRSAYEAEATQRLLAEHNAQEALQHQQAAEANFQKARQTVNQMLTRTAATRLAHVPQMTLVRQSLLEDARRFYQQVLPERSNDPDLQHEAARLCNGLGQVYQLLELHKQAEETFREGVVLQEPLVAAFPDQQAYRSSLAAILENWGRTQFATGRYRLAEQNYRQAIAYFDKLVLDFPAEPSLRHELAQAHQNLAGLLQDRDRFKEAEESYRRALDLQQTRLREVPNDRIARSALANTQHDLATLLVDANRPQEAKAIWRQAITRQEKLVNDFATVPEYGEALAKSYNGLGNLVKHSGRLPEAQQLYQQALAQQTKLANSFPTVPGYRRGLANTYNNLGLLFGSDRPDEAEKAHQHALEIRRKLALDFPAVPDHHSELGATLNNLALLRIERDGPGDLEQARQLLSEAVTHQQTALRINPRNPTYRQFLRNHYWNLAEILVLLGVEMII